MVEFKPFSDSEKNVLCKLLQNGTILYDQLQYVAFETVRRVQLINF